MKEKDENTKEAGKELKTDFIVEEEEEEKREEEEEEREGPREANRASSQKVRRKRRKDDKGRESRRRSRRNEGKRSQNKTAKVSRLSCGARAGSPLQLLLVPIWQDQSPRVAKTTVATSTFGVQPWAHNLSQKALKQ
jgi:hypothetical protein